MHVPIANMEYISDWSSVPINRYEQAQNTGACKIIESLLCIHSIISMQDIMSGRSTEL